MLDVGYEPRKPGVKRKFPWDELEVGETFLVPDRTTQQFTGTMAYANKSRAPKRFASRTVGKSVMVRRVK